MGYITDPEKIVRDLESHGLEGLVEILSAPLPQAIEIRSPQLDQVRFLLYSLRRVINGDWKVRLGLSADCLIVEPKAWKGKGSFGLYEGGKGSSSWESGSCGSTQVGETSFLTPEEREQVKEAARIIRMERGEEVPENG
jgi:hypothetical protein